MKDECFIRGNVPMTKSEIRAISLSKLEIKPDSVIYDIGAGTGSVSIEAALLAPKGHIYAVEQKEEACELIRQNQEKFGISNLTILYGKAPEQLAALPTPDCVFIGGTGGNMEPILDAIYDGSASVRVVLNVITLESQIQILDYLRRKELEAELVNVQVSRAMPLGSYHMMQAQNPIMVITIEGRKGEA